MSKPNCLQCIVLKQSWPPSFHERVTSSELSITVIALSAAADFELFPLYVYLCYSSCIKPVLMHEIQINIDL